MSIETSAVEAYISVTLKANATIAAALASKALTGIFANAVPRQQATPYILSTLANSADTVYSAAIRVNVQVVYQVRVVSRDWTVTSMQAYADAIDVSLHGKTGSALGHAIEGCIREAPYLQVQEGQDLPWRHLGGRYRFWVAA